jgi:hypothetical protein
MSAIPNLHAIVRVSMTPVHVARHKLLHGRKTFRFRGREYPYFFHPYNGTWKNERIVEMPISEAFLQGVPEHEILELGNVTWHYRPSRRHEVVDKYEKGEGVKNMDVIDIPGPARYRRITAISTIEHVGFDETPMDRAKIPQALEVLRGLLLPGGEALVTIPIGYNPLLDDDLREGAVKFDELAFLKANDSGFGWHEATAEECWGTVYRDYASTALALGYLRKA